MKNFDSFKRWHSRIVDIFAVREWHMFGRIVIKILIPDYSRHTSARPNRCCWWENLPRVALHWSMLNGPFSWMGLGKGHHFIEGENFRQLGDFLVLVIWESLRMLCMWTRAKLPRMDLATFDNTSKTRGGGSLLSTMPLVMTFSKDLQYETSIGSLGFQLHKWWHD